jgi:transcriptional regulator with XRE-family HTH domain
MNDNEGRQPEARAEKRSERRPHGEVGASPGDVRTLPGISSSPFPVAFTCLVQRRGLSYRQLAYKTRLSSAYLNHISNGSRAVPGDRRIQQIARALGVSPDFFVEYRRRHLAQLLENSVPLLDELYVVLCERAAPSNELPRLLTSAARRSRRRSSA